MLTVRFNYTQLFELVRQPSPENQADLCAFLLLSKFNLVGTRQCRVPTVFHNLNRNMKSIISVNISVNIFPLPVN